MQGTQKGHLPQGPCWFRRPRSAGKLSHPRIFVYLGPWLNRQQDKTWFGKNLTFAVCVRGSEKNMDSGQVKCEFNFRFSSLTIIQTVRIAILKNAKLSWNNTDLFHFVTKFIKSCVHTSISTQQTCISLVVSFT